MSKKHKPQWHEPVEGVMEDTGDPIEDTIEVGAVTLIDGPIAPVPLGTRSHEGAEYIPPRRSAGPMPDFGTLNQTQGLDQTQDKVKELAQKTQDDTQNMGANIADKAQDAAKGVADKAQDAAKGVADKAQELTQKVSESASAAKAAVSDTVGSVKSAAGNAGGAGKTALGTAGMALWTVAQRSPLQAIALIASIIWLFRSNKEAASRPTVSLPDAAAKVGTVAGQVQVAAGNLSAQVSEQAQRSAGWFGTTLHDNPLAIGALAVALGAAAGFIIPETPYEDSLLGQKRDELVAQAQSAAQDITHKVTTVAQTVAHEALETAKEEAKNQGLTPQ